ncbi:MAG: hypothetical protein P8Z68_04965 [Kineosporiaceae bacterium]
MSRRSVLGPVLLRIREAVLLPGARRAVRLWWVGLPGWVQALAIYGLSRIVDAIILDRVARFQSAAILRQVFWLVPGTDPNGTPGYLGFVSLWDGEWYHLIARDGYPEVLPRDETGTVPQNPWAFYPLYPYLVRFLMGITGASWPLTASLVALASGALAVVLMRSVVARVAGPSLALWTVALFVSFPSAPVLQLAYTESLSLLLLLGVLWTLQRGWYLSTAVLVLLVGLSRPIAVPLAAVIGIHLLRHLYGWFRWRRAAGPRGRGATGDAALTGDGAGVAIPDGVGAGTPDGESAGTPAPDGARAGTPDGEAFGRPPSLRSLATLFVATVAAGLAAVLWPLIAWARTGERNAYLETMAAWRSHANMAPFYPWWANARLWLGDWGGPLFLAALLIVLALWLTGPRARVISGDLRVWVIAYLGYLGAVLDVHTSVARYLLLLFPLGTLLAAASPSRAFRWSLVLASTAAQIVWVVWLWRISAPPEWPP